MVTKRTKVVIIGAGATGVSIKRLCDLNNLESILIGTTPEYKNPGFFYVSKKYEGICDKSIIVKADVLGEKDRSIYMLKSRGIKNTDESVKISSFDKLPYDEVGYVLNDDLWNVDKIDSLVTNIDIKGKFVESDGLRIYYDYLISTIPLPIFVKLSYKSSMGYLDHVPIFIKQETVKDSTPEGEMRVLYDTSDSDYYRISQYGTRRVYEICSAYNSNPGRVFIPVIPGKIFDNKEAQSIVSEIESSNNVLLLGRYARWSYRFMLHDAIDIFISKLL